MFTKQRVSSRREVNTERYILSTLPILYIPFWKKNGTKFLSSDGGGYACNVTGATYTQQGRSFDGVANVVYMGDIPTLELSNNFSVEAWVKPITIQVAGDNHPIISRRYFGNNWTLDIGVATAGKLYAAGWVATVEQLDVEGVRVLQANQWYHIFWTYGDRSLFYINGILDRNTVGVGALDTSSTDTSIGKFHEAGGGALNAVIGEVREYPRVFSPQQINIDYRMTRWRYQ